MIKKGPWIVKKEKIVYKNKWINVREDKVIRPDGKNGIFGVVNVNPGSMVLPIDKDGNVFLVEQYRYALEKSTIEVACGGIESNESELDAAKRELKEETGIEAKEWIELGVVEPLTSMINSQIYLFIAKDLIFSTTEMEGTEDIKIIKLPFEKAIEWAMDGTITCAVSVAMILKAKLYNK